jgi:putative FmdB family regulatory protein
MPNFDYKCNKCGFVNEYNTNKSLPKEFRPPKKCPECKEGKMEQQFSAQNQSFDVINGYEYEYGKKAWRKHMSTVDRARVLSGEIPPY